MNCSTHPPISVIICTLGTSPQLCAAIDSVLAQGCTNMELILVHSGTAVGSLDKALADLPITIVREPAKGVCRARNRAFEYANGEFLVFIDDDVIAENEWLHRLIAGFVSEKVGGVAGRVVPVGQPYLAPSRYVSKLAVSNWELSNDTPNSASRAMSSDAGFGCNMAFRRGFLAVQKFPEHLGAGSLIGSGDESYMFLQLLRRGYSLYHCGGAVVSHRFDLETDVPERVQRLVEGAVAVHLSLMVTFKDVRRQILKELFDRSKRAFDAPNEEDLPRHWRHLSTLTKLRILAQGVVLFLRSSFS
jgi:glucosyl-dolichyl phosphate glucuronosyltransferase